MRSGRVLSSERRRGTLALVCVVAAAALLVQGVSHNQTSHYALVDALSDGTPRIDRYGAETEDKVEVDGHWYSNKAPGLALASFAPFQALDVLGIPERSRREAAERGQSGPASERGVIWALGLFGVALPALGLLLLLCGRADRVEPGFGALAATTVGLGTLVLPFSTLFFSHVLATFLVFAAFVMLWREREERPRPLLVALAGILAGLAVTTEYPLALVAAALAAYAAAGGIRRGATFAAGAAIGALPLLAYNWWAFGSPVHVSYSGFEAQSQGFFGVRVPKPDIALDLLFSSKGLLVMSPVLAMGVAGVAMLYRRGLRAEGLTIAAVALAVFAYNAGFYLEGDPNHPFGGTVPGPRLLIPLIPFLGVGLAPAYRRWPLPTAALALVSAAWMLVATATEPLIGTDVSRWGERLLDGDFTATVLTELGAGNGWLALAPFLLLVVGAGALAIWSAPLAQRR